MCNKVLFGLKYWEIIEVTNNETLRNVWRKFVNKFLTTLEYTFN